MTAIGKDTSKPLTPSKLGELYPTPKSYDDLEKEAAERQEMFKKRRTKTPAFKIAAFGTILFVAIAYYASNIELLWMFGGMIIIIFSYAVWFILSLFAIKWFRYTRSIYYEYDSPALLFWIAYLLLLAMPLVVLLNNWVQHPLLEYWLAILAAYNFVLLYLDAKITLQTK